MAVLFKPQSHDPSVDCKINLVSHDQCFSMEGEMSEHNAEKVDIDHDTITK